MESSVGTVHLDEIGQIAGRDGNFRSHPEEEAHLFAELGDRVVALLDQLLHDRQLLVVGRIVAGFDALVGERREHAAQRIEPHLVARMKSHDLWLATLKDPAGNTLALMSEVSRNHEEEKSV